HLSAGDCTGQCQKHFFGSRSGRAQRQHNCSKQQAFHDCHRQLSVKTSKNGLRITRKIASCPLQTNGARFSRQVYEVGPPDGGYEVRITPRFMDALWLALGLMAGSAAAQDQAGFVTGSLGDTPLELTVSPDFSEATIIGTYVDTSLLATQIDGGGGPVTLILTFNGELA